VKYMKVYTAGLKEKNSINHNIKKVLASKSDVLFAYIHGSFLKGDFRDIDVAVYLKNKKRPIKYEMELESELEKKLRYPVDVRVLNVSPLSFRFKAIKNGELIFCRDECTRVNFETATFVLYHDFSFYRKMYMREALNLEV